MVEGVTDGIMEGLFADALARKKVISMGVHRVEVAKGAGFACERVEGGDRKP